MIVVDTSALMAIARDEPASEACLQVLFGESEVLISAGTLAETLIVAGRRNLGEEMARLIGALSLRIAPVSEAEAKRVGHAHDRWGRGVHPAGLNFGDCFAYALAIEKGCPLLFVGEDFARTDIASALS
ncbi:MAG: type II toxin-antitoxin system VapC family toxin [Caulobacteraceae bacterium]